MSVRLEVELNGVRVPVVLDDDALATIAVAVPAVPSRDGEQWPEWMRLATAARYIDVTENALRKRAERGELAHSQEAPGCALWFSRRAPGARKDRCGAAVPRLRESLTPRSVCAPPADGEGSAVC